MECEYNNKFVNLQNCMWSNEYNEECNITKDKEYVTIIVGTHKNGNPRKEPFMFERLQMSSCGNTLNNKIK